MFSALDVFGVKNYWNRTRKSPAAGPQKRRPLFEPLEARHLLSVSPADLAAIQAAYPDLKLPDDMAEYNVIDIAAENLSDASLRAAIDEAGTTTTPDLIICRTSSEYNTIVLGGTELSIDINAGDFGSVTIVSLGEENLTIDGDQQSQVFSVTGSADVSLAGLVITNGNTDYGGGGGIYNDGSTLTITDCTISGNFASSGGGIFNGNSGTLTITNSTISGNSASGTGGGIYNGRTLTITNSTISGNTASAGGGIGNGRTLTITNSTISGNSASGTGGGI